MEDKIIFLIIGILFAVLLILMILNFVWLFPVMKNSKEEEPLVEIINTLIPDDNLRNNLEFSGEICEKNIKNSLENGIYDTFNFKMKEIHKYSTGLVAILFIQIGFIVLLFLFSFCVLSSTSSARGAGSFFRCVLITHIIITIIVSLLNLIFFILLSVYFYKGKINEFKDFGECLFFDEANFNKTYKYIFLVYKSCKKVFIVNIIYLVFNCSLLFSGWIYRCYY